jgi:hypothetical protein
MTRQNFLRLALLSTAFAASCGGEETTGDFAIVKFVADKTSVTAGETVTLSWESTGATKVAITATPLQGGSATDLMASGSFTSMILSQTTTFKLTITAESRDQKEATVTVEVSGISIVSFTATPASAPRNTPVMLSYQIAGTPSGTTITDQDNRVVYTGSSETTVTTSDMPQKNTTYTLKVMSPAGAPEATAMVEISAVLPEVIAFTAGPVIRGETVPLAWMTRNADQVQIREGDTVRRNWSNSVNGTAQLTIDAATTTLTLDARNGDGMVSRDLVIIAEDRPTITVFELTPESYNTASTEASLTYAVEQATSVALRINNVDVPNFPSSQLAGTFTFEVTGGEAVVTLVAINPAAQATREGTILEGFEDLEPNNVPNQAIPLAGDGVGFRGSIGTDDVDFFSVAVPEGGRIYALAGFANGQCSGDTALRLFAPDATTELGYVDEVVFPPIAPCAEINPLIEGFADSLSAGTYYLAVEGGLTHTSTETYTLTVVVTGAATPVEGITYTAIGTPEWRMTDCSVFSTTIGDGMAGFNPFLDLMDEIFRPLHLVEPQAATLMNEIPHVRPYENEISTAVAIRGYQPKTEFTVAEYTPPEGLALFCMMLPTASSTTGATFDGDGLPLIPHTLFPILDVISVTRDGQPYGVDANVELPSFVDLGLPNAGEGVSHYILRDLQSKDFADAAIPATGSYVWSQTMTDSTGNGWRIDVPFVVQ